MFIFKKYKTFSVLIYSYINTSGIGKTRNFQFPISASVDTSVYLYGKMFYISFII